MITNEPSHRTIGERIRHFREASSLSQDQVAEAVHVTRQAVSNWERGKTSPDLKTIEALCIVFKVDISMLTGIEKLHDNNVLDRQNSIMDKKQEKTLYWVVLVSFALNCLLKQFFPSVVFFLIGSIVHFTFSSANRRKDYSMLAGYDSRISYRTDVLHKLVNHMEKRIMLSSAGYLILVACLSQVEVPSTVGGLLVVFYTLDMIAWMMILNHKYGEELYEKHEDFLAARMMERVTILFMTQMFGAILLFIGLMEAFDIQNNSAEAGGMVMFLFAYMGVTLGAFFYESSLVRKKAVEGKPRGISRVFYASAVVAIVILGLMVRYATMI